jgi:uncharacterized protein (TIGR00369 family)
VSAHPPIFYGGPENLFRVDELRLDDAVARGSMSAGQWLTGYDGRPCAGSLGVLIDDVLGYAVVAVGPPEHWSVSTEITIDVVGPIDPAASRFHAEARAVSVDAQGSFARGEMIDDSGALVAVFTQRGHYVPMSVADLTPTAPPELLPEAQGMGALIGAALADDASGPRVDLPAAAAVQNAMGILHGGIALATSDLIAATALGVDGTHPLETASIRIVYIRPVAGGSRIEFRPRVLHRGRSLGVVDVEGRIGGKTHTVARVTSHSVR